MTFSTSSEVLVNSRVIGAAAIRVAFLADAVGNALAALAQTLIALFLVCLFAYFVLRWALPRLMNTTHLGGGDAHRLVRIVEVTPLDARKRLYVVTIADRALLLASSEQGMQLITEVETAVVAAHEEEAARRRHVQRAAKEAALANTIATFKGLLGRRK